MLIADGYGELVAARLFDFFNRHSPWHLALWSIGTALAVEEVAEYSDLTRAGAFPSLGGLQYVSESTTRLASSDRGVAPGALADALSEALKVNAAKTEAGADTLRHLAARVGDGYLSRLSLAARSADRPGIEALSSSVAAHLVDLGFSPGFLHQWLRALVKEDPRELAIADILEEGAALCTKALQDFEVLVPFVAVPGGYPGPMPSGWLNSHQTKEWLEHSAAAPLGDLRQSGSVVLVIPARDPWSAVERAAEVVTQVSARITVGPRMGKLRTKGIAWVRDHSQVYPLNPRTRVQLRSLKTARHLFEVSVDPADAAIDDAIEIFSALESGTRGAALTGGWAAVEGLLLRPNESPDVLAADRLAAIVACAFPRAELTTLSYRHRPMDEDDLLRDLGGATSNAERCRIVEASVRSGRSPEVVRPSDRALLRRVEAMIAAPDEKLGNVRRYVADTIRRMYTQRNLIMHAGSFQSVTLRATLRTAPGLVAAGMDRILDARSGPNRLPPLGLAARAEAELGLLGTPAARPLSSLLD